MISPKLILLGNLLPQVDVFGLEPVFQLLDFRIRSLKGFFRLFTLVDFLQEQRIGLWSALRSAA